MIFKHVHGRRGAVSDTPARRWARFLALCLLTALIWTWASFLLERQSVLIAFRAMLYPKFWLTALLFFALTALFSLLTDHLLAGGLLGGLPLLLLGLVNYFKLSITGTPLLLTDLVMATKLGGIVALNAESLIPSFSTVLAILVVIAWSVALGFASKPLALPSRRQSALASLAPLAALVVVFWLALDPLVLTPLCLPLSSGSISQEQVNLTSGTPLGLLRTLRLQAQMDERFSDSQLDAMLDQAEAELDPGAPEGSVHPNVILILSESFFDVTELPGVTFSEDPIPEFHALQKEGVSGHFHTRSLGYGTCNIELEVLTGINTHLVYNQDLSTMDPSRLSRLPAVPQLLKNAGYRTVMLHMYDDSIYHRDPLMQAVGFDERYFSSDFSALDPQAAAAPDYWTFMDEQLSGGYYSDAYMTELLIDLYEQSDRSHPLLAYGISMENHTPHDADKYAPGEVTVSFDAPLTEEAQGALTASSQGCANASQALGALTDYFRDRDEPTVILFFGDHRPGLGVAGSNLDRVYTQLYKAAGEWSGSATIQQVAQLRSTSYLIWANDPSLLPAPAGTLEEKSSNYFGLSVLDAANVKRPLYWQLLDQLSQTRLIDCMEYSMGVDLEAQPFTPGSGSDYELLTRMGAILRRSLYRDDTFAQRLWR